MKKTDIKAVMAKTSKAGTLAGLKHSDLATVFEGLKAHIEQAVPAHIDAARIIQMAANTVAKNPKLAECSALSIIGAVVEAATLGFKPSNALGQVYLIPYGQHVQLQIGYKGYIDLARRSGEIKHLFGYVVREGDEFNYSLGLNPNIHHVPAETRGEITHVYAVAHYNSGGYNFVVLTKAQIEALRMRNPMQRSRINGAWATDYEAMAIAKAIKQLSKFMPLSDEMMKASYIDGAAFGEHSLSNNNTGVNIDAVTPEWEEMREVDAAGEEE
jgi:recombination protein RecT